MAIINLPREDFEKYIKLTDEIKEKIFMFGVSLENVTDESIELDVTPDRPDLLSFHGFMRAFLAFLGKKPGLKSYVVKDGGKSYEVVVDKSVTGVRPYTACAIVRGLKFDEAKIKEIIDVQEKLHETYGRKRKKVAIGIYPLEKIKLPIRFEARRPEDICFVPLDFDRELNGIEILQRHPTGREYAHLLEGMKKFPVFVDSKGEILSMPPIINSALTGKITEKTRDVFIECSGFDFRVVSKALNMLVTVLADMGGTIYSMKLRYPDKTRVTPELMPEKVKLDKTNVERLLGIKLSETQMKKLLARMGHGYEKGYVLVPAWRVDVMHEVDLIEDIAIAYGYDNFEPEVPAIATTAKASAMEEFKSKIAELLVGLGMLEIMSYTLTTKKAQYANMLADENMARPIEVLEPRTELSILRENLLHLACKTLGDNVNAEYPQRIFELGKVFSHDEDGKSETGVREEERLAVALAPGNFTEAKQVLEYLARMLDIKLKFRPAKHESFIEGRVASVLLDGTQIGYVGELHPAVLRNWHIKMPAAAFEISIEEIFEKKFCKN